MKRKLAACISLMFLCILFYACDPCRNLDCISSNYNGIFRIVRASDSTDLVFGPTRAYDKSQIRFYSLRGTDTSFYSYQPYFLPGTGYDSVLYITFFPKADTVYMRLNSTDVDTLRISYRTSENKCCGKVTDIENFRFNGSVNIPGNQGTQLIRK